MVGQTVTGRKTPVWLQVLNRSVPGPLGLPILYVR